MINAFPSLLHSIALVAASVVAAIGETAAIAAATALLLMVLPAITAAARWRIWIGVFVSALLLPLVPALHRPSQFAASADAPLHVRSGWAVGLLSLWLLLFFYRGARLLQSAMLLHRLSRRATPIVVSEEFSALLRAESKGRIRSAVKLCSSNDVDVPSIVGFFEPRILLPTTLLEKMSPLDLRQIVLHEMEHLHRNDDWTNLLQKIGLVLLPINPVLFWVERRLCIERELACDDGVLRATGAGKAYATCLVNLAEHSLLRRSMTLALSAWQRQSELTHRVRRVLQAPQPLRDPRRALLSAAAAMVVVAGSIFLFARTPELIAFGPDAQSQSTPSLSSTREPAHLFRNMAAPHVEMVSAVMPNRTQPSLPKRKLSPLRHRVSPSITTHTTRLEPWMVLTSWGDVRSLPRLALAVSEDSQVTYAAIPIRDGWLVVQL
jgi:beta-lactamase regulating signal transducer with metallopeptidase domain